MVTKNFNELQTIADNSDNKHILLAYKVTKGLILKNSNRSAKKAQAGDLWEQIIKEEIVDYVFTLISMINYCELLISEIKTYGEEEVIEEALALILKMQQIAKKEHLFPIFIETMMLHSKFLLLKGNLMKAKAILEQAEINSNEYGLSKLLLEVKNERKNLEDNLEKWNELVKKGAPMFERIEQAKLSEYIQQLQRKGII